MDDERAYAQPPQPSRSSRPVWATARLTILLAGVLAILVAAVVLLPGGPISLPGAAPSASASSPPVAASVSIEPSVSPTFVRPTPTPQPTFVAYLVKAGDNLTSIARTFATTPRSIAFWNRDTYPSLDPDSPSYKPNNIQVGWVLRLIPGTVFDEDSAPSPSPGEAASSPPTQQPATAPSSPPPAASTVVSHGPRGTNQVALTFDMGGRLDPAVEIMTWLVDNRVQATIFPTGEAGTTTTEGRAALAIVRDHPELFVLANHSWDHPSFTELTAAQIADQLNRTEEALLGYVGRTSKPYFRPPFGAWNKAVREAVGRAGWRYCVMWDVDTIDWRPTSDGGPTAADIEAKVLANAEGGSIVLMHLGGYHTLEALPGLLDGLRTKGLRPVTLAEMLGP